MIVKDNRRIEIIITTVMVLVLIVLVARIIFRPRQAARSGALPVTDTQAGAATLYERLELKSKAIAIQRDPFSQSLASAAKKNPYGLSLSGIMADKNQFIAIINDEVVQKGAVLPNGMTVAEISAAAVTVQDKNTVLELKLE